MRYNPYVTETATAEAIAMKHGLILANSLLHNSIQVEADAVEVVNACACLGRIWGEAKAIFANCFVTVGMIGNVKFFYTV